MTDQQRADLAEEKRIREHNRRVLEDSIVRYFRMNPESTYRDSANRFGVSANTLALYHQRGKRRQATK